MTANWGVTTDQPLAASELETLRLTLVAGYAVAVVTSLVAVVPSGSDHLNSGFIILAAVESVVALLLAVWSSMPPGVIKFFAFPGSVLCISAAVAVARPMSVVPIYYLWPALTCGHFGNRRDARLTILLMNVSFAIALFFFAHDPQVPGIAYLSVISVFFMVLVGYQRQRASSLALTRELAHAASTDSLTGLLNRRAFGDAFAREVERARTSQLPLSVVVFDLDHFKNLNDELGHAAGDDALIGFADIVRAECSDRTDVLGRMGGEEFAVVLFDTDAAGARRTADAIAAALADWSRARPNAVVTGPLTTSAGIATLRPGCDAPAELLVVADRALYAAKRAGRNRVMSAGDSAARILAHVA